MESFCKILFGICILQRIGIVFMKKPHIIMIVADDLGWNDVSFHGSQQIRTPNIDKLANDGIILNNYYVLPICTPTRSAIMTGRYPIHTGMQEDTIFAPNAWGVGLDEKFLPEYLKDLGYKTHAIGKWHLGFFAKEYTPTYRGFDSYFGFYEGKSDYYDHSNKETYWGLDLHRNGKPVWNEWGNYSTDMFTAEAEDRIKEHNSDESLFLYVAYQAVHSALKGDPLQAPQKWIDQYKHIKHPGRRKYAAMVGCMDHGIGRIHKALADKGILDDSVIVFTTDNGGPANGFDLNWANNYPLRGVKATLYEGGVRGAAFIYSKLLRHPKRVSRDLMHVTDWLPTLITLAGSELPSEHKSDGYDLWDTLQNKKKSPRQEVLINIDLHVWNNQALRVGDWKIIHEGNRWDNWFPPPEAMTFNETEAERSDAQVKCGRPIPKHAIRCSGNATLFCLFNIKDDPCEIDDVSEKYPDILNTMISRLEAYKSSMVPSRRNTTDDPLANPNYHQGVWEPWIKL